MIRASSLLFTAYSPWPLFGHDLQNNVRYVSVNRADDPMIHDYVVRDLSENIDSRLHFLPVYRSDPDKRIWMKNLQEYSISRLFIYADTETFSWPIEYDWASREPQVFREKCRSKAAVVFEVVLP